MLKSWILLLAKLIFTIKKLLEFGHVFLCIICKVHYTMDLRDYYRTCIPACYHYTKFKLIFIVNFWQRPGAVVCN